MKSTLRLAAVALVVFLASQVGAVAIPGNQSLPTPADQASSAIAVAQPALQPVPAKIDEKLFRQLEVTETAKFVVEFAARADVTAASSIGDFTARGIAVVDALQATATRSQAAALDIVADQGGSAESFWSRNVMVVDGDAALIDALAALPGVAEIRQERVYPLVQPVARTEAVEVAVSDPEWGIAQIGADQVWQQGILGGGIVVANIDSGVDYTHPALSNQYRGNIGDGNFVHDYNWWDPTGECGEAPCDSAGHGTHTMGTMVGGDGPGPFAPDIGVAPGARWIAAKGCEDFGCSESALLSSGEWVLAPTDVNGENPDPGLRPDIVNNSWGGPPGDELFLEMVQNWRAAGIIPVFSSGNPGPFCGAGGSPGDYLESLSVGATDIDDVIADFSGRGPSVFGKINPDIAAPGVEVVSSVPGGAYEAFSGTSMAAPHAAGTLALMMSAAPGLIGDFDGATGALRTTALDIPDLTCGGDEDGDPNNVYGEGRIDALAAVDLVANGGTLEGTVTSAQDSSPIGGARVEANNGERNFGTVTADDGTYNLFLAEGEYLVTANAFGFETQAESGVAIATDETTLQDFELDSLPSAALRGRVSRAEDGRAVAGAKVEVLGVPVAPVTTDRSGRYSFTLPIGTYDVEASQGGCMSRETATVELLDDTGLSFALTQNIDDFGHGCFPIGFDWVDASLPTTVYGDDQAGRLPMPFTFDYFGNSYNDLFIASNGYVAFEDQFFGFSDYFNTPIPSAADPNAAIYAVWQDLWVVGESRVEYDLLPASTATGRGLVVEFSNVAPLGQDQGADFQVKLWESGAIDLLYGENMANVALGSSATAGIEGPAGEDGLQLSFREPLLTDQSAWRFALVPTGHVAGVVTNANDGSPVAGALVSALPGGRSTTTAEDGTYSLRLVPGRYKVNIEANNYVPATSNITVRASRTAQLDAALLAPRTEVTPTEIAAQTELGESATEVVTIANTGSAALEWELRERDEGGDPPVLPPAPLVRVVRPAGWGPFEVPDDFGPSFVAEPTFEGPLTPIIEDPLGDAVGPVDIGTVSGGSDGAEMSLLIEFSPETPMGQTVGEIYLDTDQDAATGLPPEALNGLPTQDIGMEYFIDMFAAPEGVAFIVDAELFELVGEVAVVTEGQSYRLDVPLGILGGDDGSIDLDMVFGNFEQPTDWAADVGHGTIEPFRDAPWMGGEPQSGIIEPGDSQEVEVTLGGPGIEPGEYSGLLVVTSNDPLQPSQEVAVTLSVSLPEGEGALSGAVTNARDGAGVVAELVVFAERDGVPVEVATTSDETGHYQLFAPEGEWPVEVVATGFDAFAGVVSVQGGFESTFDVALEPLWPNATVDGGPLDFTIAVGESAQAELTLANLGGLVDLEFEVKEKAATADPLALPPVERPAGTPDGSSTEPSTATSSTVQPRLLEDSTALVLLDALPWESEALLIVVDANGVIFDIAGSAEMADIDLSPYDVVFISNDQPQQFYEAYAANAARFEDYVAGGGFLWFGAAAWGANGGDATGLPLPGGVSLSDFVGEFENFVTQPGHPVVDGVPEVFFGSEASHTTFVGAPDGSTIAVGAESGEPTLIEYGVGGGRVLAFAQPLEYAWEFGEDGGLILENSVPYAFAFESFTDIEWMSVDPVDGVVAPDGSQALTVTVDTAGLEPGDYAAEIVVLTNDPLHPSITVSVGLVVTG